MERSGTAGAASPERDSIAERARTLRTLLVAGMVVLALASLVAIVRHPARWQGYLPYVAMLAAHALVYALSRTGRLRLAVGVHATIYVAVVLADMWLSGGVHGPAGFVLPPIVLVVGLTWSGRAAVVTAATTSLLLLGLLLLERRGALPAAHPTESLTVWIVATAALVITGVILAVALRVIAESRQRAHEHALVRARLEEQLLQVRRLETVGRLAAGIAHDFNNILTVVLSQAGLLARSPDARAVESSRQIKEATLRAAALTRQLLAFGRRQVLEPRDLDLHEVVRGVEPFLRQFAGGKAMLRVELHAAPMIVHADATQLEQVLLNLVGNARDALRERGDITIRTRVEGEAVALEVADTGEGMTPEVRAHLFEPFFTTKATGKGTGLGLATVHGIVEQSGGVISVDSQVGRGTRFTIVWPLVPAERAAALALAPAAPAARARILIVDDDAQVRAATQTILAEAGHEVRAAGSAAEALAALDGEPPALLLTDVVMPDGSGPELARRLRERLPALKVLFMSGYAQEHISRQGVLAEGVFFIAKPFERAALLARVDAVLAARTTGALGVADEARPRPTLAAV